MKETDWISGCMSYRCSILENVPFTFVDLFAGIGGFHAALQPRGGQLVLACDIDPRARNVYARNWLNARQDELLRGDLLPLTQRRCAEIPDGDVLTAGFPCQPFSKSGRQRGVSEERGQLFYSILKVLQYRRPRLVLLENVRNLAGPRHRQDFDEMVKLMRDLGYFVPSQPAVLSPHELPQSRGGTPQHRERLFIAGVFVGKRKANQLRDLTLFPATERRVDGNPNWDMKRFLRQHPKGPESQEQIKLEGEPLSAAEAWDEFVGHFREKRPGESLPGFPLWTDYWRRRSSMRIPRDTPDWKRVIIDKNSTFYETNTRWIDSWIKRSSLKDLAPSLRKFEWQAGSASSVWDCLLQFRPSGIRVKRPSYAPALVAIGQAPVLGWEKREVSVSEAVVLQGFSPDFDFGEQKRSDSLRQLGNAVHVGAAGHAFDATVLLARQLGVGWADRFRTRDEIAS